MHLHLGHASHYGDGLSYRSQKAGSWPSRFWSVEFQHGCQGLLLTKPSAEDQLVKSEWWGVIWCVAPESTIHQDQAAAYSETERFSLSLISSILPKLICALSDFCMPPLSFSFFLLLLDIPFLFMVLGTLVSHLLAIETLDFTFVHPVPLFLNRRDHVKGCGSTRAPTFLI